MKHFNKLNYKRPNYSLTKTKINNLIKKLKNENNYKNHLNIIKKIINIQNNIEQMHDYADINNMRNLKDKFYILEMNYWNKYKPKYDQLFNPFYEVIQNSSYKNKLIKEIPTNFFKTIEYKLKLQSENILELQTQENKLKSKYLDIINQKFIYNEEEYSISSISKFLSSSNRETRKDAHDTLNNFYLSNQEKLDNIYFDLIQVRNKIAKKLNLDNYTNYSLYSLRRFGYNYNDIHKFRNNIIKYIIPLCDKLNKLKIKNLEVEKLEYFDSVFFKESPIPKSEGKELLINIESSLKKIDTDLAKFYKEMLNNGYIDLETRDNKINFAITNYLTKTCYPTITGNFKNTSLDIKIASHELGHAYQKYNASKMDKKYIISALLKYPTFEIAEMFSYAMELIIMPYVDNLVSEKDYKKYCFLQIYNMVTSLPYICLIDEFQEQIYSNHNLTKKDIRKTWKDLTKKYHLEEFNQGHPNLDAGGYFYRQSHLFINPFYYIDYALSYFGAFAIWSSSKNNINYFKELSSIASYYSLQELITKYNLPSPFEEESIKNIVNKLEQELEKYKC